MPPAYTTVQKGAIAEFMAFTSTSQSVAAKALKSSGWNAEQAIDSADLVIKLRSLLEPPHIRLLREDWLDAPLDATQEEIEIQSALHELHPTRYAAWPQPVENYCVPCDLPLPNGPHADLWDKHLAELDKKRLFLVICKWIRMYHHNQMTREQVFVMAKFALRRPKMREQELNLQLASLNIEWGSHQMTSSEVKVEDETSLLPPTQVWRQNWATILPHRFPTSKFQRQDPLAPSDQPKVPNVSPLQSIFPCTKETIKEMAVIIEAARGIYNPNKAIEQLQNLVYAISDVVFESQIRSILDFGFDAFEIALSLYNRHFQLVDDRVRDSNNVDTKSMNKICYSLASYDEAFKSGSRVPTGRLLDYIIEDIELIRFGQSGGRTCAAIARIKLLNEFSNKKVMQSVASPSTLPFLDDIKDLRIDPTDIVAKMWFAIRGLPWLEIHDSLSDYSLKGQVSNVLRNFTMSENGPTLEETAKEIKSLVGGSTDLDIGKYILAVSSNGFIPCHRVARRVCREVRLAAWKESCYVEPTIKPSGKSGWLHEDFTGKKSSLIPYSMLDKTARIKTIHQDFIHDMIHQDQATEAFFKIMGNIHSAEENLVLIMAACEIPWELYFQPSSKIMQKHGFHFRDRAGSEQRVSGEFGRNDQIALRGNENAVQKHPNGLLERSEKKESLGHKQKLPIRTIFKHSRERVAQQKSLSLPVIVQMDCLRSELSSLDGEVPVTTLARTANRPVSEETLRAGFSTKKPSPVALSSAKELPASEPFLAESRLSDSKPIGPRKRKRRQLTGQTLMAAQLELQLDRETADRQIEYHIRHIRQLREFKRKAIPSSCGSSTCSASLSSSQSEASDEDSVPIRHLPGQGRSLRHCEQDQDREFDTNFGYYSYFQKTGTTKPTTTTLNKVFDEYRDDPEDNDLIGTDGTVRYLGDIDVALDEPAMLSALALVAAPTMGELSRPEFVRGWDSLGISTIPQMKSAAVNMRKNLPTDAELFKRTYKHTFVLAKPPGQKGVQLEAAIEFWRMLFGEGGMEWKGEPDADDDSEDEIDWLTMWIEFVQTRWRKAVSRDLWDQTLIFAKKTLDDPSLQWWSEEAAWPGVVDEFVGWVKTKREGADGGEKMDTN